MNWLDSQQIIEAFGQWVAIAVTIIIFLETAFILTSFLPGDSLLFLTGLALAATESWLPDPLGFLIIWLAAILGTQVGYRTGRLIGPPLFEKERNFILNPRVLAKTHEFFERYGVRSIVLARFVPILRALVPMLAGISQMDRKKFFRVNVLGASLWVGVFTISGYLLGNVPWIRENLEATVLVIVVGTSLLLPLELLREHLARRSKRSATASEDGQA